MKSLNESAPEMTLGFRKGRKTKLADAKRSVATKNESTPVSELPIIPKEKAHIRETMDK